MNEKQVNQWLSRKFSQVGWALTVYVVIMNVIVMAVEVVDAVGMILRGTAVDMDALSSNGWGYILTIAVGVFILHSWKGRDYWKQEILVTNKPMTAGVFFSAVCLCIGIQPLNSLWVGLLELMMNGLGKSLMPLLENVSGTSDTFSMFLYMAFVAPIFEEVLFRGYVLRSLRPFGKRFAIVCSAFLFGIYHGNLIQTPLAFLVGLVLGFVAAEYSIYWSIALHMFNNLVVSDLLARLAGLLPELTANLIIGSMMLVLTAVSVVLLLVKRREIREYRRNDRMDRRCLKRFFLNSGILVLMLMQAVSMARLFWI